MPIFLVVCIEIIKAEFLPRVKRYFYVPLFKYFSRKPKKHFEKCSSFIVVNKWANDFDSIFLCI